MGRFAMPVVGQPGGGHAARSTPSLPAVLKRPASASPVSRPASLYNIAVPSKLKDTLDSWGSQLVTCVRACCEASCRDVGTSKSALLMRVKLRVGTDCSGAEAPIWALRQMNIPHRHMFSCDWNAQVRELIASASPPDGPIFDNLLTRKIEDIPDVDMYVCGFPCTPYSMLRRHRSRLLKEEAAKPLKKLLEVLEVRKPPLAVLENVLGIEKVMRQVCKMFTKLGCYFVIVVKIDCKELGVPVRRPRYYFILVRKDLAITHDVARLASVGKAIMGACKKPVEGTVLDLMFSAGQTQGNKMMGGRDVGTSRRPTWPLKHAAFRRKLGVGQPKSFKASDALRLTNERQRDAWQMLADAHPGKNIIADMSQNVDRCSVSTNGVCPTITPNCVMCVMAAGRSVSPMEALALHFFPVHRMKIPTTVTPRSLAKMGGNTMHLKSVGLAMCMGLAMVRMDVGKSGRSSDVAVGKPGRSSDVDVGKSGRSSDVVFLDLDAGSGGSSSTRKRKSLKKGCARNRAHGKRRRTDVKHI